MTGCADKVNVTGMSTGITPGEDEFTVTVPEYVPMESSVGSTETVICNGVELPAGAADSQGTPFAVEACTVTGTDVSDETLTCWLGGVGLPILNAKVREVGSAANTGEVETVRATGTVRGLLADSEDVRITSPL